MIRLLFIVLVPVYLFTGGCEKKATPCVGTAIEDCICTKEYKPVCGCDDKTYGNACMANCAGITQYEEGPCNP